VAILLVIAIRNRACRTVCRTVDRARSPPAGAVLGRARCGCAHGASCSGGAGRLGARGRHAIVVVVVVVAILLVIAIRNRACRTVCRTVDRARSPPAGAVLGRARCRGAHGGRRSACTDGGGVRGHHTARGPPPALVVIIVVIVIVIVVIVVIVIVVVIVVVIVGQTAAGRLGFDLL